MNLRLVSNSLHDDWRLDALCAQVSCAEFHPNKGKGEKTMTNFAKAVCALCSVTQECLSFALEHDEQHGVWGGLSPKARRAVKRRLEAESHELAS